MKFFPDPIPADEPLAGLLMELDRHEDEVGLRDANVYVRFPVYRSTANNPVVAETLIIAPLHGILLLGYADPRFDENPFAHAKASIDEVYSYLVGRLMRDSELKSGVRTLSFSVEPCIVTPNASASADGDVKIISHWRDVGRVVEGMVGPTLSEEGDLPMLIATVEGSKSLRPISVGHRVATADSNYVIALNRLETSLAQFDLQQKHGMVPAATGFQRIRGLAGSGKTVILCMKAATTAIGDPLSEAIVTFWTRSLYQHVESTVRRFYMEFDDREPDWKRLQVMHGWGGRSTIGVYAKACEANGLSPLTFRDAEFNAPGRGFAFACQQLLDLEELRPIADFILIDEGQDFPAEFVRLCNRVARKGVTIAYDELQNIFQVDVPPFEALVDTSTERNPDVVLHRCYRNPKEVIVCAHAIGFGLYAPIPAQMLESKEHWEDIGYEVIQGDFRPNSPTEILRSDSNSVTIISDLFQPNQIVSDVQFPDMETEISYVVESIETDLKNGLLPEDILVISVDSRAAKAYLRSIEHQLEERGIRAHNIHEDRFDLRRFRKDGAVTLSTVQKAKGNETFMVYIVGVDALFYDMPTVRRRNTIFVAMTRAKAWVRISGTGEGAQRFHEELEIARGKCPYLSFSYPDEQKLKVMKRDLFGPRSKEERLKEDLEDLLHRLPPDDVAKILQQWSLKKPKKTGE